MSLGLASSERGAEQQAMRELLLMAPVFLAFLLCNPQGLPPATQLFFLILFLSSLAFFGPLEEICSLRIHNSMYFIFTEPGREKGHFFFFLLELGLWLSDRNWHYSARQVSTHTVVQVSQHLPNPQE